MTSDQAKSVRFSCKQIEIIDTMAEYLGTDFSNVIRSCINYRYEELVKHGLIEPRSKGIPVESLEELEESMGKDVNLAIEFNGRKIPLIATIKK